MWPQTTISVLAYRKLIPRCCLMHVIVPCQQQVGPDDQKETRLRVTLEVAGAPPRQDLWCQHNLDVALKENPNGIYRHIIYQWVLERTQSCDTACVVNYLPNFDCTCIYERSTSFACHAAQLCHALRPHPRHHGPTSTRGRSGRHVFAYHCAINHCTNAFNNINSCASLEQNI